MDKSTFAIAVAGLALSGINTLGGILLGWWALHRDRAHLKVKAYKSYPALMDSTVHHIVTAPENPEISIEALNNGRRPMTVTGAGFMLRPSPRIRLRCIAELILGRSRRMKGQLVYIQNSIGNRELKEYESWAYSAPLKSLTQAMKKSAPSGYSEWRAFVADSAGKHHTAHLPSVLLQELNRATCTN